MMRLSVVLLLSVLLCVVFSCGSGLPVIKRVNELAPPKNVVVENASGQIVLKWRPSYHAQAPEFAGYAIYLAKKSLLFAPLKDLPAPVLVPNGVTRYVLTGLDSTQLYFLHVRSRMRNGDLSLPSLPELIWPKTEVR